MKKALPIIIVVIVIVVVVVLAIVLSGGKKEETTEEGITEVLSSLEDVAIAKEIYGFSGTIKEIKDKTFVLEAWISMEDENAAPVKTMVKAVVTDQTEITKLKFPEVPEDSDEPVFPEETAMSFDELKVGDEIDIATVDNISENIKNKTEFDLKHIFIIER